MRCKEVEDEPKTFALIFETGDEIAGVLRKFAKDQGLRGSSFKAIGALSYAKGGICAAADRDRRGAARHRAACATKEP
jgi:predicted DNA-binding protein with PD1-like motif